MWEEPAEADTKGAATHIFLASTVIIVFEVLWGLGCVGPCVSSASAGPPKESSVARKYYVGLLCVDKWYNKACQNSSYAYSHHVFLGFWRLYSL